MDEMTLDDVQKAQEKMQEEFQEVMETFSEREAQAQEELNQAIWGPEED